MREGWPPAPDLGCSPGIPVLAPDAQLHEVEEARDHGGERCGEVSDPAHPAEPPTGELPEHPRGDQCPGRGPEVLRDRLGRHEPRTLLGRRHPARQGLNRDHTEGARHHEAHEQGERGLLGVAAGVSQRALAERLGSSNERYRLRRPQRPRTAAAGAPPRPRTRKDSARTHTRVSGRCKGFYGTSGPSPTAPLDDRRAILGERDRPPPKPCRRRRTSRGRRRPLRRADRRGAPGVLEGRAPSEGAQPEPEGRLDGSIG